MLFALHELEVSHHEDAGAGLDGPDVEEEDELLELGGDPGALPRRKPAKNSPVVYGQITNLAMEIAHSAKNLLKSLVVRTPLFPKPVFTTL